jgi:hypothetical protein
MSMHGLGALRTTVILSCLVIAVWFASPEKAFSAENPAESPSTGLYVKVRLTQPFKASKLKPGGMVEGTLARDVYAADHKMFSAGSTVQVKVDHLEKRRRTPNDHWPGVIQLFTPRHEKFPVFTKALIRQGEQETSLEVSLITVSRMRDVHAQAKKKKPGESDEPGAVQVSKENKTKSATPTLILEAKNTEEPNTELPGAEDKAEDERQRPSEPQTLPIGTRCRILLLGSVSASKSKPGDTVQARLLEPVILNSILALPAGTIFEGRVMKNRPPRWLSRSGSLYLAFNQLTLPTGQNVTIAGSLAGAELDRRSHTRIDSEGQLHGERPGNVWMVINAGVTAGIAKEVDDGVQLVIEAIVSTATDASTAGTARIIASCVSGVYMATRKGRDVVLPRFTEVEISLDRPVFLDTTPHPAVASNSGGK